jgi:hypothetical protein
MMGCCRHCANILKRLEALERRSGPRDAADGGVLSELAALERAFTTAAASRHRLVNDALATALEAADISSPQELGWLLRRCAGQHGAFLVERVRATRDGILWRVRVLRV